ncbi:MAG: hypothetical protein K2G93_03395 [Rikenella sp.]|nr:hypothetical protein [Rikenella sp.]
MSHVGDHGACLTSTPNGSNILYLRFLSSVVTPHYTSFRAHGFQLRCLQE